jgi:hypothetical protein
MQASKSFVATDAGSDGAGDATADGFGGADCEEHPETTHAVASAIKNAHPDRRSCGMIEILDWMDRTEVVLRVQQRSASRSPVAPIAAGYHIRKPGEEVSGPAARLIRKSG